MSSQQAKPWDETIVDGLGVRYQILERLTMRVECLADRVHGPLDVLENQQGPVEKKNPSGLRPKVKAIFDGCDEMFERMLAALDRLEA